MRIDEEDDIRAAREVDPDFLLDIHMTITGREYFNDRVWSDTRNIGVVKSLVRHSLVRKIGDVGDKRAAVFTGRRDAELPFSSRNAATP